MFFSPHWINKQYYNTVYSTRITLNTSGRKWMTLILTSARLWFRNTTKLQPKWKGSLLYEDISQEIKILCTDPAFLQSPSLYRVWLWGGQQAQLVLQGSLRSPHQISSGAVLPAQSQYRQQLCCTASLCQAHRFHNIYPTSNEAVGGEWKVQVL